MPLQCTVTFVNLRDENQPEKINPQSLSPPAIHLPEDKHNAPLYCHSYMPLQCTITFVNLSDKNQFEKINPQPLLPPAIHLPDVKDSRRRINSLLDVSNLAIDNFLSAVSAVPMQSLGTCFTVYPSTLIPPSVTSPRQSSPLGPSQHLLCGQPVFPLFARKPDLYHQALKKSAK